MDNHTDSLLTAAMLAEYLRVSTPTVYRMCGEGLPYYTLRDGGDRRFILEDVLAWIRDRRAVSVL